MTTKLFSLFAVCILLGLVMLACGGGASDNAANTGTTNSSTSNTVGGGTASSGDKVGVAECDDFLAKYETCVSGKVPAAAQATFKSSIETWRNSWRELAKTPQGKAGLAQACKSASEQAKTSLSSYGCSW